MILDTGATPNKNMAVTSKYMTESVACETSDSKGNKYLMKGAVIANY